MSLRTIKEKIYKLIFGDYYQLSLERRISILMNFLTLIIIIAGTINNVLLDVNIWSSIVFIITFFVILVFFLISRNSENFQRSVIPLWLVSLIVIPIAWFLNAGYDGNIYILLYIYFLALYTISLKKFQKYVFISFVSMYALLVTFSFYHPNWVIPYDNKYQRFADFLIGGVIYFIFIYYIMYIIVQNYSIERQKYSLLNQELMQKNQEIAENILKLELSEQKYRDLVEYSPFAILIYQNDKIIYVNNECLRLMHAKNKEELLNKNLIDFIPNENKSQTLNIIKNVFDKNKISNTEVENISTFVGSLIDIDAKVIPIIYQDKEAYQIIVQDISERKKSEAIINQKNQELAELNAAKDKFFSIIAHDLRSPFSGFLGLTKMMSENIYSFTREELEEISTNMQKSSSNLYTLLENLLEWSRMQGSNIDFNPEKCLLYNIANENIEIIYANASQKDIKIFNHISKSIEVELDISMINSVFRNLISNAIKFTNPGGEIIIGAKKQFVEDKSYIHVFVKDNGIGIDQDLLSKLFKVDQKVSRIGTAGEQSTGLGLLLCKEFIKKHNGKIWVESEIDHGSVFYFSIPYTSKQ